MKHNKQIQKQAITPEVEEVKDNKALARRLVNLLKVNYVQQMMVLRELRDGKYYRALGYSSLEELITTELPFTISAAKRLLIVADTLGADKDIEKLIGDGNLKELSTIAQNPELTYKGGGKVVTEGGEEHSLEDYIEDIKAQNQNAQKKHEQELQRTKKRLGEMQNHSKELERSYQGEIEELKHKINIIAESRGLDPEELCAVRGKKDALILIQETFAQVNKSLGQLANIPEEIRDPELASSLVQVITSIDSGVKALREEWAALLFMPSPDEII